LADGGKDSFLVAMELLIIAEHIMNCKDCEKLYNMLKEHAEKFADEKTKKMMNALVLWEGVFEKEFERETKETESEKERTFTLSYR